MEHHLLKLEVAVAVQAAGFHAELEARAPDGSWRADVLATSPDGAQRMAWEVQLSAITADEVAARTARYRAQDIRVCWIGTGRRSWMDTAPAVRACTPPAGDATSASGASNNPGVGDVDEGGPGGPGGGGWTVGAGLWRFQTPAGRWRPVTAPLDAFVDWALHERVVPRLPGPVGSSTMWESGWTAPRYLDDARAHLERPRRGRPVQAWVETGPWPRPRTSTPAATWVPSSRSREPTAAEHVTLPLAVAWRRRPAWTWLPGAAARWLRETGVTGQLVFGFDDFAPHWAAGVPIRAGGQPVALLQPLPHALDHAALPADLPILVDAPTTRDQLSPGRARAARIIVLTQPGTA